MKYNFCLQTQDGIEVPANMLYGMANSDHDIRFGFLTEENRRNREYLQIPELNSGFDTVYWYRESDITEIKADEYGCYIAGKCADRIPLTFITEIHGEGNYQVKITLYAVKEVKEVYVFLGCRRLAHIVMLQNAKKYQKSIKYRWQTCMIKAKNW